MARRIRWQIVIAGVGALLVIALLGQLALATTTVSQPLTGGTYTEAVRGTPEQVVPLLNSPLIDPTGRDIGALMFDGLTRIGLDGLPTSALAESWQIDQDGLVYIFRLRDDVTWHDGEPFTADDVVFTIRAIQSEDFNGDPALANVWRNVLIDRLDDYTLRFTLDAPYGPFLSAARVPIMPEHLLSDIPVGEWATSSFAQQPVGTGPYELAEWTPERAVLTANEDYFGVGPFVDRLELRFVESTQAALPLLTDGEIQALGRSTLVAPELPLVNLPSTIRRLMLPLDEYVTLSFNLRAAPLDDLALRQALARGLDKNVLVEQVQEGQVVRLDNPILPGWWSFDPTVGWYAYDPTAAEQMLDDLGYLRAEDGIRARAGEPLRLPLITADEPGRVAAAEEIARQWGALGVQVDITVLEADELRARLRNRDFVLAMHRLARLGPDPDVFALWHSSQAEEGLNYAGLQDDLIDELLIDGLTEYELAARNEAYAAFQRHWVELVPAITLYQPLYTFAISNEVDGLGFEQDPLVGGRLLIGREDRYRNVPRWFINSSREVRGTLR